MSLRKLCPIHIEVLSNGTSASRNMRFFVEQPTLQVSGTHSHEFFEFHRLHLLWAALVYSAAENGLRKWSQCVRPQALLIPIHRAFEPLL
jgi:hypothetical protein